MPGGILIAETARHVRAIANDARTDEPDNFKFLCEAAIATGVQDDPAALELNALLGKVLFPKATPLRFIRNPRLCAQYALPLAFLRQPPAEANGVAELFLELHAAGAVQAVSYPEYRNIEMDFVAARLSGRDFAPVSLDRFRLAFGWMTRDHAYGVTHLMLYNSHFGQRKVSYAADAAGMIEAMIAAADAAGDDDLLLELILCHATMEGADSQRKRFYGSRVAERRSNLLAALGPAPEPAVFIKAYHPLFVAWMYEALGVDGMQFPVERRRHDARGLVMAAFARRDPIAALAAAADLLAEFGADPAIERLVDCQGRLLAGATSRLA